MPDYRSEYAAFCDAHQLPLFYQPWWLDAVCLQGHWAAAIFKDNAETVAGVLPYYQTRRRHLNFLAMPPLTPFLGPWLALDLNDARSSTRFSKEKAAMETLIDQLPRVAHQSFNCHYRVGNWLPFYWQGFQQTTRYSYRLPLLPAEEALFAGMEGRTRTAIRKARKTVEVVRTDDIQAFYRLNQLTFQHRGWEIPYRAAFVQQLDRVLAERGRRQIYLAVDDRGRRHAGAYIVWDRQSAYCLMLGADPALRNSGAVALLIWTAIQDAARHLNIFDFEGSVIPGVERFFRSFGGELTPYFHLYRSRNRWIAAAKTIFSGPGR